MSDPFRDDGDAAVARAEALQAELDRTKRERDELEAKLAAAEDKAQKFDAIEDAKRRAIERELEKELAVKERQQRRREQARARGLVPEAVRERRAKIRGGVIGGGVLVAIVLVMVIPGYLQAKRHRAWLVTKAARELAFSEWSAMLALHKCVHDRETGIAGVRASALQPDPRVVEHRRVSWSYDQRCGKALDVLAHSRELPAEARLACEEWNKAMTAADAPLAELSSYFEKGDWKDDDYASGPAKWELALQRIARVQSAVDEVRGSVQPLVRAWIVKLAEMLPPEKRARVEFGLRIDHVADLVHLAELGKGNVPEIQREAKAILDAGATAPLEIRRVLRSTQTLETLVRGEYLSEPSSYEMWDAVDDLDTAPVPALAEEPSKGCDGDGGA